MPVRVRPQAPIKSRISGSRIFTPRRGEQSVIRAIARKETITYFMAIFLEAIAKPDFTDILNEVKDLKSLKIRDSSLRSE
ncbi:MAG: hypothetical protein ACLQED_02085 [Desulfobaccales bacterium]